jgi:hypothetical protein
MLLEVQKVFAHHLTSTIVSEIIILMLECLQFLDASEVIKAGIKGSFSLNDFNNS